MEKIRNFCIIAHIDHGKSTLADRFLEITGTIQKRDMKEQTLDQMDLERERGITIKLQPARMAWKVGTSVNQSTGKPGESKLVHRMTGSPIHSSFELNLIDTPGHIDFTYEVSRSLAAVEGAILLVDASQGIEAQTLANAYLALEHDLTIIPVLNKIDLPAADVPRRTEELRTAFGFKPEEILCVSGKTGEGVPELLDAVCERIPAPSEKLPGATRALIFDSIYDPHRGVIAYIRVVDGEFTASRDKVRALGTGADTEILECGIFTPAMKRVDRLSAGEIGYVVTGTKSIRDVRVGDTLAREMA